MEVTPDGNDDNNGQIVDSIQADESGFSQTLESKEIDEITPEEAMTDEPGSQDVTIDSDKATPSAVPSEMTSIEDDTEKTTSATTGTTTLVETNEENMTDLIKDSESSPAHSSYR